MNYQDYLKNEKHESKYLSHLFTRILLSITLVLILTIYINLSDTNLINFKKYIFNDTLLFNKINEVYTKYFGSIVNSNNVIPVANTTNSYKNIENIDNSYKLTLNSNTFTYLESGVVVFIGEKDYGNTIIVQGIDGVDIWYSNIDSINVSMYDYVTKGDIIGEFRESTCILTLIENESYISYEKYLY